MIPKRLIYGWFGKNPKDEVSKRCIQSWREKCPDYEIVELNEDTFDIHVSPFTEDAYMMKKWAFVTDYAKFWYLVNVGGGFIVDADFYLLQGLDKLSELPAVAGYQNWGEIGTGLIGLPDNSSFASRLLGYYNKVDFKSSVTVNQMITKMMNSCYEEGKPSATHRNFYDVSTAERIVMMDKSFLDCRGTSSEILLRPDSVGVHLFTWSWVSSSSEKGIASKAENRKRNVQYIDTILSRLNPSEVYIDDRIIPEEGTIEQDKLFLEVVKNVGLPGSLSDTWKKYLTPRKRKESKSKLQEFGEEDILSSKLTSKARKKLF